VVGIDHLRQERVEERRAEPTGHELIERLAHHLSHRHPKHAGRCLIDDCDNAVVVDHHQPAFHMAQNAFVILLHPGDFFVELCPFQGRSCLMTDRGQKFDILGEERIPGAFFTNGDEARGLAFDQQRDEYLAVQARELFMQPLHFGGLSPQG
jgi:hypothetical protein